MSLLLPGVADLDITAPLAAYRRDGYARLGPLVEEEALAALRARADELMLGKITYPGLFYQRDTESGSYDDLEFGKGWQGPSLNYRKLEKLELDPLYRALLENPLFARIAREVLGEGVMLYRAVLFNKAARGGTVLPWHQDAGGLWGLDRNPVLQVWVAIDDAPVEAGCVEMLPGSHEGGLATPLGGLVPAPMAEACGAEARAVAVPARAGEGLLIHNLIWHRSGVNRTDAPRRAFTACFLAAGTKCVRKKRAPRVFPKLF